MKSKLVIFMGLSIFSTMGFSADKPVSECTRPGRVNLVRIDGHSGSYFFKVNDDDGSRSILKFSSAGNCVVVRGPAKVGTAEYTAIESLLSEVKQSAYGYRINGPGKGGLQDYFFQKIETK